MATTKKYKFKIFRKSIDVFKNGHGIVSYNAKMKVLSGKFNSFSLFFTIDDWTHSQISLKPFKVISSTPLSRKNNEQIFQISFKKKIDYEIKCIKDTDTEKRIKIIFPKKKFKKGDIIEYSWIWSCPLLYPNVEQGEKLNRGLFSAMFFSGTVEKAIYTICIEKGHSLSKKLFECEQWSSDKKQIAVSPFIKTKEGLKVEIKNVKPGHKHLLTFKSE